MSIAVSSSTPSHPHTLLFSLITHFELTFLFIPPSLANLYLLRPVLTSGTSNASDQSLPILKRTLNFSVRTAALFPTLRPM